MKKKQIVVEDNCTCGCGKVTYIPNSEYGAEWADVYHPSEPVTTTEGICAVSAKPVQYTVQFIERWT